MWSMVLCVWKRVNNRTTGKEIESMKLRYRSNDTQKGLEGSKGQGKMIEFYFIHTLCWASCVFPIYSLCMSIPLTHLMLAFLKSSISLWSSRSQTAHTHGINNSLVMMDRCKAVSPRIQWSWRSLVTRDMAALMVSQCSIVWRLRHTWSACCRYTHMEDSDFTNEHLVTVQTCLCLECLLHR